MLPLPVSQFCISAAGAGWCTPPTWHTSPRARLARPAHRDGRIRPRSFWREPPPCSCPKCRCPGRSSRRRARLTVLILRFKQLLPITAPAPPHRNAPAQPGLISPIHGPWGGVNCVTALSIFSVLFPPDGPPKFLWRKPGRPAQRIVSCSEEWEYEPPSSSNAAIRCSGIPFFFPQPRVAVRATQERGFSPGPLASQGQG